jgi:hypothetical protein
VILYCSATHLFLQVRTKQKYGIRFNSPNFFCVFSIQLRHLHRLPAQLMRAISAKLDMAIGDDKVAAVHCAFRSPRPCNFKARAYGWSIHVPIPLPHCLTVRPGLRVYRVAMTAARTRMKCVNPIHIRYCLQFSHKALYTAKRDIFNRLAPRSAGEHIPPAAPGTLRQASYSLDSGHNRRSRTSAVPQPAASLSRGALPGDYA